MAELDNGGKWRLFSHVGWVAEKAAKLHHLLWINQRRTSHPATFHQVLVTGQQ